MKNLIYLGQHDDYIINLINQTKSEMPETNFVSMEPDSLYDAFFKIIEVSPQVVIFDFNFLHTVRRDLSDQVRRILPNTFFLIVVPSKDAAVKIGRLSAVGDFIYCIKNPTNDDVLNFFRHVFYSDIHKGSPAPKVKFKDHLTLYQCVWVKYLSRTYACLESNRLWETKKEIAIDFPYFRNLFHSKIHQIVNRSTDDIHSHFKYSYQLEFNYLTEDLDSAEKSKLTKDYEYEISTGIISDELYAILDEFLAKKMMVLAQDKKKDSTSKSLKSHDASLSRLILLSKTVYFNRIMSMEEKDYFFRENITIYDVKGHLLKSGTLALESCNVSIVHRLKILNPQSEILRDRPSIIVINYSLFNDVERIKELIASSTQVRDYFPFVIVFNYEETTVEVLRDKLEYHFVMSTKITPNESIIIKFLDIYRKKKKERETAKSLKKLGGQWENNPKFLKQDQKVLHEHRIDKSLDDMESLIPFSISVELVSMSEHEICFISETPITRGEIFRINKPFNMQLVVVGVESPGKYRATIHFINETDKYTLRGFVADLLEFQKMGTSELYAHDLFVFKKKHFHLNVSTSV
ncbi:MAG: hypothetical protein AB7I27_10335 [Bacteriovoracaceae bacterium]